MADVLFMREKIPRTIILTRGRSPNQAFYYFISLDQVQFRDKDNPELLVKGRSSQETKLVGTPVDAVHRLVGDL